MFRRHLLPIAGCTAAAPLLLACWYSLGTIAPAAPKSLQAAEEIATTLGLHHRSDNSAGTVTIRLIISTTPVTYERANAMHMGLHDHPCWKDTVAACAPWQDYVYLADPEHGVVWGEVFLYGDPALIRTLTAAPIWQEHPWRQPP